VRDSLGTTIVEHSAILPDGVPLLRLEEVPGVRIGVSEGSEAYQFFRVTDALRRSDGSVIVLDQSRTIRAYDSAGAHLWTAGRHGEGPGEFNYTQHVSQLSGDTLAVWDPGLGRLSLFTGAGHFVREWSVPGTAGVAIALGVAGGNRLLLDRRVLERVVAGGHNALTIESELHLLDVVQGADTVLGRRHNAIQYQEVDENGAYSPPIFGTTAVFAPAPGGFWYGTGEAAELERSTATGSRTILRWPGTGSVVREADVNAVIEKWISESEATADLRQFLAAYARTHPRAERFPAYEEIRVDPSGKLWVREFVREHEDDGIRRWLVFSADGHSLVARMEHSRDITILRVDMHGVLGVEQDDMGVEHIVYRRVIG
jgi:hypothetical protein